MRTTILLLHVAFGISRPGAGSVLLTTTCSAIKQPQWPEYDGVVGKKDGSHIQHLHANCGGADNYSAGETQLDCDLLERWNADESSTEK